MRWKMFRTEPDPPTTGPARAGACTDVGQVRSENQDTYALFPPEAPRVAVVADGMGGHEDGGTASRVAVRALSEHFERAGGPTRQRLAEAVEAANTAVWREAHVDGHLRRMGTTCTALAFENGSAFLAHVGDSRAYRVRTSGVEQLSEDHTVAAELSAGGLMSAEEVARHPRRHALTRALGTGPSVDVFTRDLGPVRDGDHFVLCSDGLAQVSLEEVQRVVLRYDPQEAAEWLVSQANALGGLDNITVVIIQPLPAA